MGIFEEIFADIGDEQSIEQSLSTFSSHMTNIVDILGKVNQHSLLLLDELGAGTDPQEGAALAMATSGGPSPASSQDLWRPPTIRNSRPTVLRQPLCKMPAWSLILQLFARNLSLYAGSSWPKQCLRNCKRLGLSEVIVGDASQQVDQDNDVNRIIEQLEEQTLESRKRLDNIREVEQENLKMNRVLKKLYNELNREKETELNKAREQAAEIVDMALSESDQILKNLHSKSQLKPHEIIEAKAKLKKLAPEKVDLSKNKVLQKAKKKRAPKVGDDIVVLSYGQRGTLTSQLKDGRWEAQVGLIKMTLEEKEFDLVQAQQEKQVKKKQVNVVKRTSGRGPQARLDLRGKRYEEAMNELDAFIDQALLNNMAQVDIIHGIGTGVIREGVTKYLQRNKHVKSFGYAPQNAGGSGATIVTFKG